MATFDSGKAIGAVTRLIVRGLSTAQINAHAGRPDKIKSDFSGVNIFLYEVERNAEMSNISLYEGESPPLWLLLHYLMTAVDKGESDTDAAHDLLGQAMAWLQNHNFLNPGKNVPEAKALAFSGEFPKITFEPRASDLVSKVTHPGASEHFRLGVAFQVRPVVIVPAMPEKFSLLVGVNYQAAKQPIIGSDGLALNVLPSPGPKLIRVVPDRIIAGEKTILEIQGEDLNLVGLECLIGGVKYPISSQRPDRIRVEASVRSAQLSAGEHPLLVQHPLLHGRKRRSNLLQVRVLPTVNAVTYQAPTLSVRGKMLGGETDDVWVALYGQDGVVQFVSEEAKTDKEQETISVKIPQSISQALNSPVLVIVWVNGQQATASPSITL